MDGHKIPIPSSADSSGEVEESAAAGWGRGDEVATQSPDEASGKAQALGVAGQQNQDLGDSAPGGTPSSQGVASSTMGGSQDLGDSAPGGTPSSQGAASSTMGGNQDLGDSAPGGTPSSQGAASSTMGGNHFDMEEPSTSHGNRSSTSEIDLKRLIIVNAFRESGTESERIDFAFELVKPFLKSDITDLEINDVRKNIFALRSAYKKKYKESQYKFDKFLISNNVWLNMKFRLPHICLRSSLPAQEGYSQQSKEWEELSRYAKRRKVLDISGRPSSELALALKTSAHKEGDFQMEKIIKYVTASPNRPGKILKLIEKKEISNRPYTPEEALAQLLDEGLTKKNYVNIRKKNRSLGWDIYPPYYKILEAKKACRPPVDKCTFTDTSASVELAALLVHTGTRIVELQAEVITLYLSKKCKKQVSATLVCTWGFDGSSGQSVYKQKFSDPTHNLQDDSNFFATTVIPLRLISEDGTILWNNRAPQSVRFCRPLRLQFIKESTAVILTEKNIVEEEIKNLQRLSVSITDDLSIVLDFSLYLTLIDGKVLAAITGTASSMTCPLCKAPPSSFNDLKNISKKYTVNEQSLQYGMSPLHAWIRLFEFCLHLGYKIVIKKWQARGAENKRLVLLRKQDVHDKMKEKLNLIVDVPRPNSGTSNDGNTARRAFEEYETFAEVLGIDKEFVLGLRTLLIAMSSHFTLNKTRFSNKCKDIAERFVELYPWYYMPVTAHKILVHGEQYIEKSILQIGMLAEDAAESKNKLYRHHRYFHARKRNRRDTMMDVFNRSMDTSDVITSSISTIDRYKGRKRKVFPPEVVALFENPVATELFESDESDSAASDESDHEEPKDFDETCNIVLEREIYDFEIPDDSNDNLDS